MEESLQTILFDRKNICSGRQEDLFYIVNIPALYIQSLKVSEEKVLLFLFWWTLANHSCLLPKFLKKTLRKSSVYFTAIQCVSSQPCIKSEDTSKMLNCNNYWSFTYYSQVLGKKKTSCIMWTKYFCQEINGEAKLQVSWWQHSVSRSKPWVCLPRKGQRCTILPRDVQTRSWPLKFNTQYYKQPMLLKAVHLVSGT